jgi:hypothetical protein
MRQSLKHHLLTITLAVRADLLSKQAESLLSFGGVVHLPITTDKDDLIFRVVTSRVIGGIPQPLLLKQKLPLIPLLDKRTDLIFQISQHAMGSTRMLQP